MIHKFPFIDIPGFFEDTDYSALSDIVRTLPDTGHLLEVGSLFGRSTVAWDELLTAANKQWKITCIDRWGKIPGFHTHPVPERILSTIRGNDIKEVLDHRDAHKLFRKYTADRSIRSIRVEWDENFVWNEQMDVIFEDSEHDKAYLDRALPYWWNKLKPGGVLCGHDYCEDFGVKEAVTKLVEDTGSELELWAPYCSIWAIHKP